MKIEQIMELDEYAGRIPPAAYQQIQQQEQ